MRKYRLAVFSRAFDEPSTYEFDEPSTYEIRRGSTQIETGFADYDAAAKRLSELVAQEAVAGKRKRRVFPTDEVPHLWIHQAQEDARNKQYNLYFEGPTIYSCRDSFPVASIVTRGKKKAVLVTARTCGARTAWHIWAAKRAIPDKVPQFCVPNVKLWHEEHKDNLAHYLEEITTLLQRSGKALSEHGATYPLSRATKLVLECRAYCQFFGIKKPKLPELPVISEERMSRLRHNDATRPSPTHAWGRRIRRGSYLQTPSEPVGARIDRWLKGGHAYTGDFPDTLLRIKEDQVETSMGARFPVADMLRSVGMFRGVLAAKREWTPHGLMQPKLGYYPISMITVDGAVHAGCHVVKREAIERVLAELEGGKMNRVMVTGKGKRGMFREMTLVEVKHLKTRQMVWFKAADGSVMQGQVASHATSTGKIEVGVVCKKQFATFNEHDIAEGRMLAEVV